MNSIYFTREISVTNTTEFYEKKPIVNISGDRKGYLYLANKINESKKTQKNVHLKIDSESFSMEVVILNPSNQIKQSKIKFSERLVKKNNRINMELVVYGSVKGYDNLEKNIINLCEKPCNSHIHLDRYLQWVVNDSIEIIIDLPINNWNAKTKSKEEKYYKKIPYDESLFVLPQLDLCNENYVEIISENIAFFGLNH